MNRRTISGFIAVCSLFAAPRAFADAKQCVAQNNDGVQLRDEHHLLAAREAYRACVAEKECPELVRGECDAALADIKTAIPTLLVAVLDQDQHDISGATLTLDGEPVALDGSSIEVDPGKHELIAKSGELSSRLQVLAIESDLNRRVEIVLQPPHTDAEPATQDTPPVIAPRSKVPAYVLGGVGAAAALSFGIFAISGHSGMSSLDQCKPFCAASDVQSVRTKYTIADVSLGVSLVALAGAGFWLLSASKEKPASTASAPSAFDIGLVPELAGAGVSLRWRE
jgi:hypothetical protein